MGHPLKNKLREEFTQIRNALSEQRRKEGAELLYKRLIEELSHFAMIASYIPFRSEIDISRCNQWILENKQLILPRIDASSEFRCIFDYSELEKHPLGFYHPMDTSPLPENIDCILVPALAFDKKNYRLGYGRGDYDFLLTKWPSAHTIGVGFKEQLYGSLPHEIHDKPVNQLILC